MQLKNVKNHLPVEYYMVDWRSFADMPIIGRPKELATAVIDSRTVRSSTGMDYHLRSILNDGLLPAERATISVAYRSVKEAMSGGSLKEVNERISKKHASLHNQPISLAMDQSSRTSWEGAITPHVNNVPFSMSGQGQQAAIKISLAMDRHSENATYVMIEEPENHLSHTSLNILLFRISSLAGEEQQIFIATHSSYVTNRLGLDKLHLLGGAVPRMLSELNSDTVDYFKKLPGYDTLRMVLASKIVLVEGPSDEIIFERVFKDKYGKYPIELGVDVLSMRGLSFQRCLELCSTLDKTVAALRDNDGVDPNDLRLPLDQYLKEKKRELFISLPEHGATLEPQLIQSNGEMNLRGILGIQDNANLGTWMAREKTEAAIRIAKSEKRIVAPKYMIDAAEFIYV